MAQLLFALSSVSDFCHFMCLPGMGGLSRGCWRFADRFGSGPGLVRTRQAFWRLYPGERFGRFCDPVERCAKIRQLDEGEEQTSYPKNVHMREQSDEAEDSDDFELYFVRPVSYPFRQRMEPEKEDAESEDGKQQNYAHHDHEDVCLTRSRDEGRQMVGSSFVNGIGHTVPALAHMNLPHSASQFQIRLATRAAV